MKHFLFMNVLAAGVLLLAPAIQAQDCSNWTLWDTRGTYATSVSGWIDLSTLNPALPGGYSPFSSVGAFTNNGRGGGTGWALINAGGVQLTVEFVDVKFGAPGAECLQPFSYSYKIKEFGDITVGPVSFPGVIAGDMSTLEIFAMAPGTGPGAPVQSGHAKRISLKFQ
jgi:hypothetical protein